MRKWLPALVALFAVSCGSAAPSSDPASQASVQSSSVISTPASQSPVTPAYSATPSRASMPTSSSASPRAIEFAGRLTFPVSTDWEKAPGADRPMMTIEFSEGGKRAQGERPVLMLYTEEFSGWNQPFRDAKSIPSYDPCAGSESAAYKLPERLTDGDIIVGNRVGEYYRSVPCKGTGNRHTWLFGYVDSNDTPRGVRIDGFPAPGSEAAFPYKLVKEEYIPHATW